MTPLCRIIQESISICWPIKAEPGSDLYHLQFLMNCTLTDFTSLTIKTLFTANDEKELGIEELLMKSMHYKDSILDGIVFGSANNNKNNNNTTNIKLPFSGNLNYIRVSSHVWGLHSKLLGDAFKRVAGDPKLMMIEFPDLSMNQLEMMNEVLVRGKITSSTVGLQTWLRFFDMAMQFKMYRFAHYIVQHLLKYPLQNGMCVPLINRL